MKKPHRGPAADRFYREWSLTHDYCQCCGRPERPTDWPQASTHHIVKPGRSHEACNLLRLCHRCHLCAEGHFVTGPSGYPYPLLRQDRCLWLKEADEPDDYDLKRLIELQGWNLPDLVEVPECFELDWLRWGRRARI